MPTDFDWRVGVLDGEPLFVCQYHMARGHWQIIKHGPNGAREGGFRTMAVAEAPPQRDRGRAARRAGDRRRPLRRRRQGNGDGLAVIEVNDNPNLDHGVEDQVGKEEIWSRILQWYIKRLEA